MTRMKKQDRVILHREMLYRDVWKTPIRQLAKKYGISDVGLAKICKRMNIPLPQRGYWAKKEYGHKVEQLPLPPLKGKYPSEVTLNKSEEELLQLARNRFSASKTAHRERKRIHRLQNEMKEWETSWRVRAYIAAMHAAGSTVKPGMAEYLAWAETYADHLDPGKDFCNDALSETGFRDSYNDFSQIEK